jgi:hypothetical protein
MYAFYPMIGLTIMNREIKWTSKKWQSQGHSGLVQISPLQDYLQPSNIANKYVFNKLIRPNVSPLRYICTQIFIIIFFLWGGVIVTLTMYQR